MDQKEVSIDHSANEIISKLITILDQIFGLRAFGLIFYGSLPSYLALVGVLKIDIENLNNLPSRSLIIAISAIPIALTFTLVKIQQKRWYITTDLLNTRSFITTILIFSMTYLISLISGMIRRGYDLEILKTLDQISYSRLTTEAFLVSIVSLVICSTFRQCIVFSVKSKHQEVI